MAIVKLNHLYKCRHCSTIYIILQGRQLNSYLPVEVINGTEKADLEFDKEKHVSHLLNCAPLQKQWNEVKKIIYYQEKKIDKGRIR